MSHFLSLRLGKDVAEVIYKFLHQALVQELNQEYYVSLVCATDHGTVYFRQHGRKNATIYNSFVWNYRSQTYSTRKIYNWTKVHLGPVGSLPHRYL